MPVLVTRGALIVQNSHSTAAVLYLNIWKALSDHVSNGEKLTSFKCSVNATFLVDWVLSFFSTFSLPSLYGFVL